MKEINVFGCDHCSMVSRRKGSVARHEANYCRKNPERNTCGKCKHINYEPGFTEHLDYGETHYEGPSWYCEAKDIDLESHNLNANIDCDKYQIDA